METKEAEAEGGRGVGSQPQNWTWHSLVQVSTYVFKLFPLNIRCVLNFNGAHSIMYWHNIRYVVDGEWLVDPSKQMMTDSKGNTNNVVVVEDNRVTKCQKEVGWM